MKEPEKRPVQGERSGLVLLILAKRSVQRASEREREGCVSVAAQRCTSTTRQDNRTRALGREKTDDDREGHKTRQVENGNNRSKQKESKEG